MIEQNPVIPIQNCGANVILYISKYIVFITLYIVHIFRKHIDV